MPKGSDYQEVPPERLGRRIRGLVTDTDAAWGKLQHLPTRKVPYPDNHDIVRGDSVNAEGESNLELSSTAKPDQMSKVPITCGLSKLPLEILILIFEEVSRLKQEELWQIRLVSRQFEILATPLAFRKINLGPTFSAEFMSELRTNGKDDALLHAIAMSRLYAEEVTIYDYQQFKSYVDAIQQMRRFRVLRIPFDKVDSIRFDHKAIDLLRRCKCEFQVRVEAGETLADLAYDTRKTDSRAELRSIFVDTECGLRLEKIGMTIAGWNTLESFTTNSYLEAYSTVLEISHTVKTLKMNRSSTVEHCLGATSSQNLSELSIWFPNLVDLELNFQVGEPNRGVTIPFTDVESCRFIDRLAGFQNLRRLILKSKAPLIESPHLSLSSGIQTHWFRGCPKMVDGDGRLASYKNRAAALATNIFRRLLVRKLGVPFRLLALSVRGRAMLEADHRSAECNPGSPPWARKCLPAVFLKWEEDFQEPGGLIIQGVSAPFQTCKLCDYPMSYDGSLDENTLAKRS